MHVIRKNIKSFKKISKIKGIHKWGICWPGEANGVSDIRTWENITKIKWSGNHLVFIFLQNSLRIY